MKYPRDVEKFERWFCLGRVRAWVIFDSSRASTTPRRVITMAVILMESGMVIGGVFAGGMYEVIRKPAVMLPRARRVIEESTAGLFSFIGTKGGIRT